MAEQKSGYLVLVAMIFAVSMTFIDQTIVSISIPEIQKDLSLTSTGVQWVINGYLLSLAALFALGGKLADVFGHRRLVVIGVLIFAVSSACCGFTPDSSIDEAWLIFFRVIQGAGAALMFPAALAIVISSFPIRERGKAMAIFFGVTGAFTSIGPLAGGYLSEWTWRAIFWINIPVAILSLIFIWISKPEETKRPQPIDYRGAVLVCIGMALAVLGLQQSSTWGWGDPVTWICIVGGLLVLAFFIRFEMKQEHPLIRVAIFKDRAFAVDNVLLFLLSVAFVPLFFFASMYAQLALGWETSEAGLYLLIFFAGFATAAQFGGRVLDSRGARPTVILGSLLASVGFVFWAMKLTDLAGGSNAQWPFIVLTGVGFGLLLGPVATDAVNRAPNTSYGEATGITQTVRNYGASVGMAVLGTILILQNKSNIESELAGKVPARTASQIADEVSKAGSGAVTSSAPSGGKAEEIYHSVQQAFAQSSKTVFLCMAGVMALCFVVALIGSPAGRMEEVFADEGEAPKADPDRDPAAGPPRG
ncbi:MAG TPA: MFS transporter [Solirubrobacterales bacterium]|nr:MFS transporter [Solirubrobacterales bacterium]HMX71671.1 MFS transporter [Solirubrobacterales bacterium]HNA24908.1 MFS transporter [Solirubrobacterales bacterium]HNA44763.1 MFS transporter [Solirubrobacterales bacterium]HNE78458.1 MFS transporter [Solirubrobacterales bacterium]